MSLDDRIALAIGRAQLTAIVAQSRAEDAEARCTAAESKLAEMESSKKPQPEKP